MNGTTKCPLARAERRLDDAAALWRKASDTYFQPDDFRVHLQAGIQAFRSVTWILQSHKKEFKNFDSWYSKWQDKMRQDDVLRWLVKARNQIEKQGDLEAKSILKITGSGSWFDSDSFEMELPPQTRPKDILPLTLPCLPKEAIKDEALLKIERRWVDSEMPGSEVLDALCHCYLALRLLLLDAHGLLSGPLLGECPFFTNATSTNQELPEFMATPQQHRVVWIPLKDGASRSVEHVILTMPDDEAANEEVQRRYHCDEEVGHALNTARTFREECVVWFQLSKRMLQADGFLIPTALVKTEKNMHIFPVQMADRADKHIALRYLADSCKRLDAVAVMLINEAWVAPPAFAATGKHAIDCPHRREAVVLHGLKRTGEAVDCMNVFTKQSGRVCFGEDNIVEGEVPNILTPFLKVWNIQRKTS